MERHYSDKFFALYRQGGIAHTVAMYILGKYIDATYHFVEWSVNLQTIAENTDNDIWCSYSKVVAEIDCNLLDTHHLKRYAQMLVEPFEFFAGVYAMLSDNAKEQIKTEANKYNNVEFCFRKFLIDMQTYADRLEVLLLRYNIKLADIQTETGITISRGCEDYKRLSLWFTPGERKKYLNTEKPINPLLADKVFQKALALCIEAGFINSDLTIIGRNKALMCSVVGRCFCGDKITKDGTVYKIGDKFPTKHVNDLFHIDNSYQAWYQLNTATPPEGSETITEILQGAAR